MNTRKRRILRARKQALKYMNEQAKDGNWLSERWMRLKYQMIKGSNAEKQWRFLSDNIL